MIAFLDCETVRPDDGPDSETIAGLALITRRADDQTFIVDFLDKFQATSPWLARIVCVGVIRRDFEGEMEFTCVGPEKVILEDLEELLSGVTKIVTFNGRGFDLPLLCNRYLRYQMQPPLSVIQARDEYRFKPDRGFDVSDVITQFGATKKPSLAEACIGLGLGNPKAGGDGGKVGELFRAGKIEEIKEYCLGDVRFTRDLYDLVTGSKRPTKKKSKPVVASLPGIDPELEKDIPF